MKPYRGYVGVARADSDAGVIRGRVVNTRDMITFQGKTVAEAEHEFHEAVDDYLEFCAQRGVKPDRPFSGKFPVRTTPRLHRDLVIAADRRGVSWNASIQHALKRAARPAAVRKGRKSPAAKKSSQAKA